MAPSDKFYLLIETLVKFSFYFLITYAQGSYFNSTVMVNDQCLLIDLQGIVVGKITPQGACPYRNSYVTVKRQESSVVILKEIADLKYSYSLFPKKILKKYDVNEIALSLIRRKRIRQNELFSHQNSDGLSHFHNVEVHLGFHLAHIESIEKNCFLNAYQVSYGHLLRSNVENDFIEMILEDSYEAGAANLINRLRPKYAYYMQKKQRLHQKLQSRYLSSYGQIIAVLNPLIKARSTFSPGDSFGFSSAHIHSLFFSQTENLNTHQFYWEVQVWGSVCLNPDVDYFLIGCLEPYSPDDVRRLKQTGKNVYHCDMDQEGEEGIGNSVHRGRKL